eukprot:SAG11_NODE_21964_length_415_cov_0.636076_1_plen_40_part_10
MTSPCFAPLQTSWLRAALRYAGQHALLVVHAAVLLTVPAN